MDVSENIVWRDGRGGCVHTWADQRTCKQQGCAHTRPAALPPAPECSSTRLTESEASEATEHPGYRVSTPEFKRIIVNPSMFVGLDQFAVAFIQGCWRSRTPQGGSEQSWVISSASFDLFKDITTLLQFELCWKKSQFFATPQTRPAALFKTTFSARHIVEPALTGNHTLVAKL